MTIGDEEVRRALEMVTARLNAIGTQRGDNFEDAIERDIAAGAPTLPPPMPCVRDYVIIAKGRHTLWLYALDGDGGIRAGDDKRRAMLLTEAEAAYHLATLGDSWTMERVK